jgi:hypothetical protein
LLISNQKFFGGPDDSRAIIQKSPLVAEGKIIINLLYASALTGRLPVRIHGKSVSHFLQLIASGRNHAASSMLNTNY